MQQAHLLGELKVFCYRKKYCSFLKKGNREEVLIMLLMIKGVFKISPFINWVKNATDLVGHFRPYKLIINCCKRSAWYLAPIPLLEG